MDLSRVFMLQLFPMLEEFIMDLLFIVMEREIIKLLLGKMY